MEEWRDVKGYEGLYQVSNLGRVKSLPREWVSANGGTQRHNGLVLKPIRRNSHYFGVTLSKDGKPTKQLIHILVAEAFLDNKPKGYNVDHINNDPSDNKLSNLQIITARKNTRKDRVNKHGYTGVTFRNGKYIASTTINGVKKQIGTFVTAEEAGEAYLKYQKEIECQNVR